MPTSPRNLTCRPFLLVRGWGLGSRLVKIGPHYGSLSLWELHVLPLHPTLCTLAEVALFPSTSHAECSYPQVCAWAIAKHRNQNKYLCCMHGITNQSYFFLGWEYNVCKGCMGVSVHLLRFSIKSITLFLFCIPYCSCWDNDNIIIFTMITIQARCVHWLVNIHKLQDIYQIW